MHFKQFQCRAPVQWNVHLKLSVLCVIAIWHISVRVVRVFLFLLNSKLKSDYFVEIKCFYSHSNCSVVQSSGHTSPLLPIANEDFYPISGL